MVKTGQTATIRPVDFRSRLHPDIPVEVVDRTELVGRMGSDFLALPERVNFTTLMLISGGQGTHTIDFEAVPLVADRMVRVLPGQVQSWDLRTDVDVTAVLCAFPLPESAPSGHEVVDRTLDATSLQSAWSIVDILRSEQQRYGGDETSSLLMRRLFEGLHAIFERAAPDGLGVRVPEAYAAFRAAIERDLGSSHSVRDYARALGYSERTLSRACQTVTGLSAKAVLTQRLVLEAKRQLAHSGLPVGTIGSHLGFSEATNFHKFFVREVGSKPTDFRAAARSGSH